MDNQQERFDLELPWFTGIIEGEGWVSLIFYKSNQKNGKHTPALKGNIGVTNTDFIIMDKVAEILKRYSIKYRYNYRKACIGSDNVSRKAKIELSVENQKSLRLLCNLLLPYMVGEKKSRVLNLIQFLNIRDSKPRSGPASKYGKEEFMHYKQMYKFKGKSRSKILNDLTLDEILKGFEDKV